MAGPSDENQEDRTEFATQYRRDEFRKQGIVALSREVLSVSLLLTSGFTLYAVAQMMVPEFRSLAEVYLKFGRIEGMTKSGLMDLLYVAMKAWAWLVLPVFGAGMVVAILVCGAQVGFQISWEPMAPKWDRLDPTKGIQRLFSGAGAVEGFKALIKLVLGAFIVWQFLKSSAPQAGQIFEKDTAEIALFFGSELTKLFFLLLLTFTFLAAADYGYQRYRLENQMKMSRREVREEFKLREGDPLIRSRIRSVQRKLANARMMEAVPKADVVVTNPTHLSVALKYDAETMAAPRVLAKGADHIAMKIREIAKKHHIPLVENKPLARSLFKDVEVGHFVPRELYRAVAQVLAYVYRLKNGEWTPYQQATSTI